MKKNNVLQETKNLMEELKSKKATDLEMISQQISDASEKISAADQALREATEKMDVDAYEAARTDKRRAKIALDMYNGRLDQIRKQEMISEEESDKVIDGLLNYEKELEAGFKIAIVEPLKALSKIHADYMAEVTDTENTIRAWSGEIHQNHNTRGLTFRTDPETGEQTTRSEHPVPVRVTPYTGCEEAEDLGNYLKSVSSLIEE